MYDAMDIAEYILDYCENNLKEPITNLQLQKFLYYIQGKYLAKYNVPLFDNEIEAWAYGPVVPDVYYSFNDHMAGKIIGIKPSVEISDKAKESIKDTISELIDIPVWDLVSKTHLEDPWKNNYINGWNVGIPTEEIKNYFQNQN